MKIVPTRETSLPVAPILIMGIFLFTACFTAPEKIVDLGPVPEYREPNSISEVIDHEADMPPWVVRYVSAGIRGIETLPEYEDRYVFIGKQRGNNLESLKLWTGGFSLDQDFPRLVSERIQARFTGFADGNPGEKFGRYFEAVVKKSADTAFDGAVQEGSFWIKKKNFEDDGVSPLGETFEYYILVSIEKEILERQINMLLITTRTDLPPTKDQSAAAMRLRLSFYDEF